MKNYNLLAFLEGFPDSRRGQGRRHPLPSFLVMLILSIISGQQGIRGFTRFMKTHEVFFSDLFKLKHGVPSFGTTRTLLLVLEHDQLARRFQQWMSQYYPADSQLWISMDGKALGSTVQDAFGINQNFVYLVSAFAQDSGLVYAQGIFNSGKSYEPDQVRQLIEQLGLQDITYCLDALHCQKKHSS